MSSDLPNPRPNARSGPRRAFKLPWVAIFLAFALGTQFHSLNCVMKQSGVLKESVAIAPVVETKTTTTRLDATHNPHAGNTTENRRSPADDDSNDDDSDFERLLWPQLQNELCAGGLPQKHLGEKVLELARREFDLPPRLKPQRMRVMSTRFWDKSAFNDAVLVVDANDPSASLLYAVIWKCANNEINLYSKRYFNKLTRSNDTAYTRLHPSLHLFDNRTNPSVFQFKGVSHDNPCVYTVIRDPISHFLSGYNEIEYRFLTQEAHVEIIENKPPSFTEINQRKRRFEAFVRGILDEEHFLSSGIYKHVFPMSKMLRVLDRRNLLPTTGTHWILPTMTNLSETFPPFLAERCPKFASNYRPRDENDQLQLTPSGLPPMRQYRAFHNSSNDPFQTYEAAKIVWKEGGRAARALCHFHAIDYACFYGDNVPTGNTLKARNIPETCQKVYQSDAFRKAILGS